MKTVLFLILILSRALFSYEKSNEKLVLSQITSKNTQEQIEGIRSIKEFQLHHLLPRISQILRNQNPNREIYIEILNLHESYGDTLTNYYPEAPEDYEWILGHSDDDALICELIDILKERKDRRFIYPILSLVTHNSSIVRKSAFQYLTGFKDDRILPYILQLGASENPLLRYYYLESLHYLHDERAYLYVNKQLQDQNPTIRLMAIQVLTTFPQKESENTILNLSKTDPNFEVRRATLYFAKNFGNKKNHIIIQSLQDSKKEVREVALEILSLSGDKNIAVHVSRFLEQEVESSLQFKGIETLLSLKSDGGGLGLSALLLSNTQSEVRKLSAYAMGELSKQNSSGYLNKSLVTEQNYDVKMEIIKAISKKKDKSSVKPLLSKVGDSSENLQIRKESIAALKEISDPNTLPEIFEYIDEYKEIQTELKDYFRFMLSKIYQKKSKT